MTPGNNVRHQSLRIESLLTPAKHYRTQPDRRTQLLQHHIGRHLEENVGYEEHEECNVVVLAFHVQILGKPLDFGIADVDATKRSVVSRLKDDSD